MAMRERTPFGPETLQRLPGSATTGLHRDAQRRDRSRRGYPAGVLVCGTRGGGPSTAELAWGLILCLARHIPEERESVRHGNWQTTIGTDLKGKVLGLLGLGNLGSHMATIGNAFGMSVIAWSQNLTDERARRVSARLVSKEELFSKSDVVSIHLQLSDRTRGLVGRRELGLMKPTAYLINTSRGPIVDEPALIEALRSEAIAGAGVDVFDPEPLPPDHPLRTMENVVMTPHLGYVTRETYETFFGDAIDDILAFVRGEPVRVLNPDVIGHLRRSP